MHLVTSAMLVSFFSLPARVKSSGLLKVVIYAIYPVEEQVLVDEHQTNKTNGESFFLSFGTNLRNVRSKFLTGSL